MIAFSFTFLTGRYHANPWDRHVNEGEVAWPPEPARILRSMIATWNRKTDANVFPESLLSDLIDALAAKPPVFQLPEGVHSHIRAFMPAPVKKKLIYDSFIRFGENTKMIVAWPELTLSNEQTELASHLLENISYLGRAESLAEGRLIVDWTDSEKISCPLEDYSGTGVEDLEKVEIVLPLTPSDWQNRREQLLETAVDRKGKSKKILEKTLPEKLTDALAVDTGDWKIAGWSSPPPVKKVVYLRSPLNRIKFRPSANTINKSLQPNKPEVARFLLAGRPQPRVEDSIKIGEVARLALMSGKGIPPIELSGRNENGPLKDGSPHSHSFFLPEDADQDGYIDHLIVYCHKGFSDEARLRLDKLTRLWISDSKSDSEDLRGREEWRLALEDIASPEKFRQVSRLLNPAKSWKSVTPYLKPWHSKKKFKEEEQVRKEISLRGHLPTSIEVFPQEFGIYPYIRAVKFKRFRSRRGIQQPDKIGCFLNIKFNEEVTGPIALGFACHYGLGLFSSENSENAE